MLPSRSWMVLALGALLLSGCARLRATPVVQNLVPGAKEKSRQAFEAQLSLARLSERNGDKQTAEQIYRLLSKSDPDNQLIRHRLGVLAAEKSRFEEAAEYFDSAARLGPPSSELLNDIGYNLYLMDRRAEAEAAFRQALELAPQNKSARINLGMLFGEAGRFDESLAEFRQAGTEADAQANLGFVKAQAGDLDGAVACYHRALALDNSLKPVAEALIQLTRHQAELKAKSSGKPQSLLGKGTPAEAGRNPATPEVSSPLPFAADARAKASRLIGAVSLGEPGAGRQQPPRQGDSNQPNAEAQQVAYMTDAPAEVVRHNLDSGPAQARPARRGRNPSRREAPPQSFDASRGNEGPLGPPLEQQRIEAGRNPTSPPMQSSGTAAMFPDANPFAAGFAAPMDSPWQRPTWTPDMTATLLTNGNATSTPANGSNVPASGDAGRIGPRLDASAVPASSFR